MNEPGTGVSGILFNRALVAAFFFSLSVAGFEGAVFRGFIHLPFPRPALIAKNVIFMAGIFLLLVIYLRSTVSRVSAVGLPRLASAYLAHTLKVAVVVGIPLKVVFLLYLKLAADDFGADPIAAFNDNGWLSSAYYAAVISVTVIGYALINRSASSAQSVARALRFIFTRSGAASIAVLSAYFIATAVIDHLSRLIEYRTVLSLVADSTLSPLGYCLFFLVAYAVSAIAAERASGAGDSRVPRPY